MGGGHCCGSCCCSRHCTTAFCPFAHPRSCSPLPSACWCLSFIHVPVPICTRCPAHCSCLFTPARLHTFDWPLFALVWPTQPACSCPLTLVPSRWLLLTPILLLMLALVCSQCHTPQSTPCHHSHFLLLLPLVLMLLPLGLRIWPSSHLSPLKPHCKNYN